MSTASQKPAPPPTWVAKYEVALAALDAAKDRWAQCPIATRIAILTEIKTGILQVAEEWATTAARNKQIAADSPRVGEEWTSGPYALMSGCNGLIQTLSQMDGKAFLDHLPKRQLVTGQTAIEVVPHSIWDRLLLSGISAEIWMQPGVTADNLKDYAASAYALSAGERRGKVALVLGAGNIAAIAPLDVFQKLFLENQVVILKMNPVNDYLTEYLEVAMKPLIERDFLRIVGGDGVAGAWLSEHPLVEEMHITGAAATHDAIVWGSGPEAAKNKANGTPKNTRRITSELGAVCPTIVVPGPWSAADLRFQAENVATQKLHNSGFNCVACQVLIVPKDWPKTATLLSNLADVMRQSPRHPYYPGTEDRLAAFHAHAGEIPEFARSTASVCLINQIADDDWFGATEVFAPALSLHQMDAPDAEGYLRRAIDWANQQLHGTLGANILIHPQTLRQIGHRRFEAIIAQFRYGTIAINGWSGLGFLLTACPWGAFPGHTLADVGSGIGTVHNTFMLEHTERTVITAPFRPFPRGLMSLQFSLLPRPPWFITHRRQDRVGQLLTAFQYRPSWSQLPRIFVNALLG